MKPFVLIILLAICLSCSQSNDPANSDSSFETGVYSGRYLHGKTNTNIYNFKISVEKITDERFKITQIDAGLIPPFEMAIKVKDGAGSNTFIKFDIPTQQIDNKTITGDSRVSIGYDALFSKSDRSLFFGFIFNNTPGDYITFEGIRQ